MKYWRMSFRIGENGYEMWPECYKRGIAAMGYYQHDEPIVGDCSKLTENEFDEIWRMKEVKAPSSQGSLKKVA